MREDQRGNSSNLISREGRGPLSYGEQQALAQQSKNQRMSAGEPNEVRQRQAAGAVGMDKKIAPRITWDALPASERFPHVPVKFR
jgi:hypothetical protein